jgi:hypothetical protein
LVSMARPFLADPEIVNKAARGDVASINTCIGCNQACLDHTFKVDTIRRAFLLRFARFSVCFTERKMKGVHVLCVCVRPSTISVRCVGCVV